MKLIKVISDFLDLNILLKCVKNFVLMVEKYNFLYVLVEKFFIWIIVFILKCSFFYYNINYIFLCFEDCNYGLILVYL